MVKITDLKEGDVVNVLFDEGEREGTVLQIDRDNKMVCVDNGIQEFWYPAEEVKPLPITDERLVTLLGFEKEETAEGTKYKKGAFRMVIHDPGNNTNIDMWYREDHRHFNHPLYIHDLQNRHLEMTKVPLERVQTH